MLDNVFWRVIFVFGLKKGNVKNVLTVCVLNSILCYELVNVFVRIKKKKRQRNISNLLKFVKLSILNKFSCKLSIWASLSLCCVPKDKMSLVNEQMKNSINKPFVNTK